MINVISSAIRAIDYNADSQTLLVVFTGGNKCRYRNVPGYVVDRFLAAPSKGRFFNQQIRGRYREV